MKTLDASQEALLESPAASLALLCKLTTYTDRLALTGAVDHYFSDGVRLYDWGNLGTVREFQPWLVGIREHRDTMNHLPAQNGSGVESTLRRVRTLTLLNYLGSDGAGYLYPTLRAENLELARVEIAALFVDRGAGQNFRDLSSLTGAEMTWLYRGRVARVGAVDESQIELELESEIPAMPWARVASNFADPLDHGGPLPIVYGAVKGMRAYGWSVPPSTTLAEPVDASATTLELTRGAGMAASNGQVLIGTEIIFYTTRSINTLTGCTRGYAGSTADTHAAGALVVELRSDPSVWIVASHRSKSVSAIYLETASGRRIRVTTGYTVNLANAGYYDEDTGAPITTTTVALSAAQLNAALSAAASANDPLTLRMLADMEGVEIELTYVSGYAFDEGTGWSTANGTQSSDTTNKTEGSASQKLVGASSLIDGCEDNTTWTSPSANTYDVTEHVEGTYAMQIEVTTSGGRAHKLFSAIDFTGKKIRFSIFVPSSHYAGLVQGGNVLFVKLGSSSTETANNVEFYFDSTEIPTPDEWHVVEIDPAGTPDASAGTYNIASTVRIGFGANCTPTKSFYVDAVYIAAGTPAMQRNATTGTVDLSASSDQYLVSVRGDGLLVGDVVRIYWSNTAGSGTTKPASYWYVDVPATELSEGAFVDVYKTAAGVGSPAAPTNVETIGVEIIGIGVGSVWVDDLRRRDSTPSPYSISTGLITKMPDVLRHLLAVQCGLGHSAIDASFNDACGSGYLNDNLHGVDLRVLGETIEDVLARLAYETRANLVADERASGTVWRLLVASSSYAWPAPTITLDRYVSLEEEGRSAANLATRWLWRYAPDGDASDEGSYGATRKTRSSTAEQKFGRLDAPTVYLPTITDANTAAEIAAYYEGELPRVASVYAIRGVPWTQAFKLERGDTCNLTPPWLGSPKKVRVIETTWRDDGLSDLRVVEVP